ncbi:hypothetical protein Bca52824_081481 [Brassica carinata]|uniref:Uncharacterized protein n=1 Tax=Brassica carinata TaxID=52824 RepID=A0A8X7PHA8_BRACI|nr:hypothetical protein Bca52824_081481 [Brassica carinata]
MLNGVETMTRCKDSLTNNLPDQFEVVGEVLVLLPPVPPVRRPRPRRYPDVSIAELLASPSRLQMPLIHPEKENNGLWFKIDKCLTDDCTSIYTSDRGEPGTIIAWSR